MSQILLYIGLGLFIIGGIGLLIAAFRTSILWGILLLLVPPIAIIYTIVHWQDAKGSLLLQMLGLLVLGAFIYMNGNGDVSSIVSKNFSVSDVEIQIPAMSHFSSSNVQNQQFSCDGRTYCSQMRSCEEAIYFLRNCPNTKMDGNNDGIPCERQWCK